MARVYLLPENADSSQSDLDWCLKVSGKYISFACYISGTPKINGMVAEVDWSNSKLVNSSPPLIFDRGILIKDAYNTIVRKSTREIFKSLAPVEGDLTIVSYSAKVVLEKYLIEAGHVAQGKWKNRPSVLCRQLLIRVCCCLAMKHMSEAEDAYGLEAFVDEMLEAKFFKKGKYKLERHDAYEWARDVEINVMDKLNWVVLPSFT
jgi:hypothetical protein